MKSQYLPIVLLVVLAGCGGKDKKKKMDTKKGKQEVFTQVDIPTAGDESTFLFDDLNNEFTGLNDNIESANLVESDNFAWLEEKDVMSNEEFKVVHFDFDQATIRADQEGLVARNIDLAKTLLSEGAEEITLVIDGHSCSSAGSRAYNLALSEKRAKTLRDRFVAAGIAPETIKIVARGAEMPAKINGQPVTGDRVAQAPNRRDEVRAIYS